MNKILKNKDTLLVIVFLSILVNLFKTASVFRAVSFPLAPADWIQWSYAILSVFILEICVLVFVSRGKTTFAGMFAFITAVVNLFYFNAFQFQDWRTNTVQVFFSFLFPLVVYFFSEEYNKEIDEENRKQSESNQKQTEDHKTLSETNRKLSEQLKEVSETNRILSEQEKEVSETNRKLSETNRTLSESNQKQSEHHKEVSEDHKTLSETNKKLSEDYKLSSETLEEVFAQHENKTKENRKLSEDYKTLSETNRKLSENLLTVSEDAKKWSNSITCEHCGTKVKSSAGLPRHKSACAMNPKNMKVKADN